MPGKAMKNRRGNWYLIALCLFNFYPLFQVFALDAQEEIDKDAIIRQSEQVVIGNITQKIETLTWKYNDQYNDEGEPVPYQETIDVYEFQIDEVVDGELPTDTIKVLIPNTDTEPDSHNDKIADLLKGKTVAIAVSTDHGALRRGYSGYNITHGVNFPAATPALRDELRHRVSAIRTDKEQDFNQSLEDAFGDPGILEDINKGDPVELPETSLEPEPTTQPTQKPDPLAHANEPEVTTESKITQAPPEPTQAPDTSYTPIYITLFFVLILLSAFLLLRK